MYVWVLCLNSQHSLSASTPDGFGAARDAVCDPHQHIPVLLPRAAEAVDRVPSAGVQQLRALGR